MRVYLYDSVSGEYIGFWDCQADPEGESESGFLVPEYSTSIEPTITEGYANVFESEAWSSIIDYRSTPTWSTDTGFPVRVTELGPLPEGVTDIEMPTDGVYLWVDGAWEKQPDVLVCTAWQIRTAATRLSWRTLIENYLSTASIDEQDYWNYYESFSNEHATLLSIFQGISKTQTDVDAIIVLGMTLYPL
jgi:hypothetical protein